MRKLCLIAFAGLALAAAPRSSAQQRVLPEQFGRWAASAPPTRISTPDTSDVIEMYSEAGLVDCTRRIYSDGQGQVSVTLGVFRDPTGAYQAYTAEISSKMYASTVGPPSAVDRDKLIVLIGNFLLEVAPPQNPSTEDLQHLVGGIRGHADQTPLPPIRGYLPEGFSDGTQKYALGPNGLRAALDKSQRSDYTKLVEEAGFADGAETILAEYHRGADSAVLLLIEYPTPQLAEQHLRHLELALPATAKTQGSTVERTGSLLTLVLAPSTAAYGGALRNAVKYQTQVTWNEPTHKITDPPWLSIVGKIIIGTMLFMGLAVALGVAFGGIRVVAKVFFPGKIFDRPEQMDVLQLGLSGKRINSRDFY